METRNTRKPRIRRLARLANHEYGNSKESQAKNMGTRTARRTAGQRRSPRSPLNRPFPSPPHLLRPFLSGVIATILLPPLTATSPTPQEMESRDVAVPHMLGRQRVDTFGDMATTSLSPGKFQSESSAMALRSARRAHVSWSCALGTVVWSFSPSEHSTGRVSLHQMSQPSPLPEKRSAALHVTSPGALQCRRRAAPPLLFGLRCRSPLCTRAFPSIGTPRPAPFSFAEVQATTVKIKCTL